MFLYRWCYCTASSVSPAAISYGDFTELRKYKTIDCWTSDASTKGVLYDICQWFRGRMGVNLPTNSVFSSVIYQTLLQYITRCSVNGMNHILLENNLQCDEIQLIAPQK
ncbi:Hypothetical_protein [Hexamita inflata]|uniref:Hypothetical_protein n=1 Tax=Hexamita inflata TaxID=28002 RepID=A0ABP1HLU7_9EUKA